MIETIREIQAPLLAAVLLLGALAKAVDRTAQGPAALLPARVRRPFSLAHAGVEAVLAVALLVLAGPFNDLARGATAVLFAVGLATLYQLRKRDPEMGCGCFGGLSTEPVGWRSMTRCGLFAAAAAGAVGLPGSGLAALADPTPWHGVALLAEVAVIVVLSPELGEIATRLRHPVPCELREVPPGRSLRRLRRSPSWSAHRPLLASTEPVDMWRHGCWWFARFAGERGGRAVDVVFAVEVGGLRPAVRAAVTDAYEDAPPVGAGAARPNAPSEASR